MITTKNSIFYHFPKTGGTWVSTILMDNLHGNRWFPTKVGSNKFSLCAEHTPPDKVPGWFKDDKFSFGFVRNPITWYQSTFCYKVMFNGWDDHDIEKSCRSDDFNAFVNAVVDRYPEGYISTMYKIFYGENLSKVDYIGRFEKLRLGLINALSSCHELTDEIRKIIMESKPANQAFSVSDKYPKVNAVYNNTTLERVRKVENWAMEKFNYE